MDKDKDEKSRTQENLEQCKSGLQLISISVCAKSILQDIDKKSLKPKWSKL